MHHNLKPKTSSQTTREPRKKSPESQHNLYTDGSSEMKEGGDEEKSLDEKPKEEPVPEVKPRRKRVLGEINDLNPKRSNEPTYIPP